MRIVVLVMIIFHFYMLAFIFHVLYLDIELFVMAWWVGFLASSQHINNTEKGNHFQVTIQCLSKLILLPSYSLQ